MACPPRNCRDPEETFALRFGSRQGRCARPGGSRSPVLHRDPDLIAEVPVEDVEAELAAALPLTQGRRFFPLIGEAVWHLAAVLLFAGAAWLLWREFRDLSFGALVAAIRD